MLLTHARARAPLSPDARQTDGGGCSSDTIRAHADSKRIRKWIARHTVIRTN